MSRSALLAFQLLPVAWALFACASHPSAPKELEERVSRVAVLPPEGENIEIQLREAIGALSGGLLRELGYEVILPARVTQVLARQGYTPWRSTWLPPGVKWQEIAESLDVDAVLLCRELGGDSVQTGVFFNQSISARFALYSRTGKQLWDATVEASDSGGVAIGSGQLLDSLRETIDAEMAGAIADLAVRLTVEGLKDLPPASPPLARPKPVIESFELVRLAEDVDTPLVLGAPLEVVITATPSGVADVSVIGFTEKFPLVETAPGIYRGAVPLVPRPGITDLRLVAHLRSDTGDAAVPMEREELLRLRPRLPAPAKARADLTDPGNRSRLVQVSWEPVEGAASYDVTRQCGAEVQRVEVDGTRTAYDDAIAEGVNEVVYFITPISAEGQRGSASAPALVRLP